MTISDDEAAELMPVVDEFVREVAARDAAAVWACFEHTDPRVLAVLGVDLLLGARARLRESCLVASPVDERRR